MILHPGLSAVHRNGLGLRHGAKGRQILTLELKNKSCTSSVATVCLCDPWKPKFNYSFFNRTAYPRFHLMPSIRINVTFIVGISQFQDTRVWSLWRLLYCMYLNLSNSDNLGRLPGNPECWGLERSKGQTGGCCNCSGMKQSRASAWLWNRMPVSHYLQLSSCYLP